ncbi:hypothetical protein Syn7502_02165 [Synechococcus sp. PCC 7502]|uniref:AbrB/MazE/SpoVT family DNA-binding domain-containing protein n=1 Tax=Synechococcus sp. PCC 7502 TaxID=1173263 RepID=UPI00029F85A0|nr:hypothetical protein [Synechococcus sp. PCC 7502]AFY74177.1 hypothetical protein Syn7502_02165 [Synechococcus sp. PCC 7502]
MVHGTFFIRNLLSIEVIAVANILVGDELGIITPKDQLVIKPIRKIHGKYDLQDLIALIPSCYQVQEENWGVPLGREVW